MTNIIDLYSQNKYTLEISDLTTTSHTRLTTCTNKSHVRFHYTNGKDYKEVFNLDGGDQELPYNNYNISLDYDVKLIEIYREVIDPVDKGFGTSCCRCYHTSDAIDTITRTTVYC